MESFQSDPGRSYPIHSPTASVSEPTAERGNEAPLLAIDENRMFREFEAEIRCRPSGSAASEKRFTVIQLFHKMRRALDHLVPVTTRKR
jgi:hypothetical protein